MWLANRKELTVIDPDGLMFGDKINSAQYDVDWYDVPTQIIRLYQLLHLYKAWKETHTVTFIGDAHGKFDNDHVFEWTFPTATYTPFDEWFKPEEKAYSVHRYADAIPTITAEDLILSFFDKMDGTIYDVPSLFNFIALDILGYDEADYKPIFDLGEKNMVCSVGARASDMLWYEKLMNPNVCRRPGGKLHVEKTPPALFPGHDTYLHLGKLIANTA